MVLLDKILKYLPALILALVPLIGIIDVYGYEQTKVFTLLILISFGALLWIIKSFKHREENANFRKFLAKTLFVWPFLLTFTVASALGVNPLNSFLGTYPYFQGVVVYFYLYFLAFLVFRSVINLNVYGLFVSLSALAVSFVAVGDWIKLHYLNIYIPTYDGRVVSTFGQPNFYAGFLLLCLPLIYLITQTGKMPVKILGRVTLVITAVAMAVSQSRAALLFTILLMVLFFGKEIFSKKRLKIFLPLLAATGVLFAVFAAGIYWMEFVTPKDPRWLNINSPEKRIYIWQAGVEVFKNQWLLGYGPENIDRAYSRLFEQPGSSLPPYYYSLRNLNINRAHSYYFDIALFAGLLGLIAWFVMQIKIFLNLKRNLTLVAVFLVFSLWSLFQIHSIVNLYLFYFLLGFSLKLGEEGK